MRKHLLDWPYKATMLLLVVSLTTAFSLRGFSPWLEGLCDRAWILEPIARALVVGLGLLDWRAV